MTGADLRLHMAVHRYQEIEPRSFAWVQTQSAWAKAEEDKRRAVLAEQGASCRSVLLTLRKSVAYLLPDLAFSLRGKLLLPVELTPDAPRPGFVQIRAAVVEPLGLTAYPQAVRGLDAQNHPTLETQPEIRFAAPLLELYHGIQESEEVHRTALIRRVLVTPKAICLRSGDRVAPWQGGPGYVVRTVRELSDRQNEYLLESEADV